MEGYFGGNFCGHYLGFLKEKGGFETITDGILEVDSIRVLSPIALKYKMPRLIFDRFAPKQELIMPEIKIISYNDMRKLGFVVVSRLAKKRWYSQQAVYFRLMKDSYIGGQKNALLQIPPKHRVEYDVANKLIRLTGRGAGPTGASEWVEV